MKQLLSVLVLGIIFSGAAKAESAPGSKVALIQMQKAISSVKEGKKAQDSLKQDWESKQKKLQAEGKKVQEAMEELRKQSMLMDEKARHEKEEVIQGQMMKLKEMEAKFTQEFQKKDMEVSEPIIKKIRAIVAQIAKDKGYTLVVDGNESLVIFAQDQDDITSEVIARYDAKK